MKNQTLFVLFILLAGIGLPKTSTAYAVFLKLFTTDCANCYAGLYLLKENYPDLPMQIIMQKGDERNQATIISLFELNKFKKADLIFSDSLYEDLERDISSELIIKNKEQQVVFRGNIKYLNLKLFQSILSMPDMGNKTVEFSPIKLSKTPALSTLTIHKNLLVFGDDFDQSFYWNPKKQLLESISIDSSLLFKCYALEEKISKRSLIPSIQYFQKSRTSPYFKPQYAFVYPKNDSIIYISFLLKTFDVNGEDTSIYGTPYLLKHHLQKQQTLSIKKVPLLIDSNTYVANENFFTLNDTFYFPVVYTKKYYNDTANSKFIYAQLVDKNNADTLQFVQYEPMKVPDRYIKHKLQYTFDNPTFSGGVITMPLAESMYDVKQNKSIPTGIPDSLFRNISKLASAELYQIKKLKFPTIIEGISLTNNKYSLLYSNDNQYYHNIVNQQGELIKHQSMAIKTISFPHFFENGQYCMYIGDDNRIFLHYLMD